MAIRSSKHKAKQHPTAATEINYALQALVKANEYGKKELADYWGATWSWMNLTVRPPGSPQPSDFDKKLEDLTNKFCAWFEATECVLGEYLTERGRHDRAIRWTSHGEGPPIITVVRVPLVAPIATNEDPGSHVQSQSATRTSYKCPPGAWTLSPPPRDRWERKRRRAIAQAEQDISSLPVRYREAID
ncbi:MAG: hypothetical protein M1836_003888 [Candelina mexicana]|nr:MAG: hypothetical protein M1836_003888 [Candelina mexicana]